MQLSSSSTALIKILMSITPPQVTQAIHQQNLRLMSRNGSIVSIFGFPTYYYGAVDTAMEGN